MVIGDILAVEASYLASFATFFSALLNLFSFAALFFLSGLSSPSLTREGSLRFGPFTFFALPVRRSPFDLPLPVDLVGLTGSAALSFVLSFLSLPSFAFDIDDLFLDYRFFLELSSTEAFYESFGVSSSLPPTIEVFF